MKIIPLVFFPFLLYLVYRRVSFAKNIKLIKIAKKLFGGVLVGNMTKICMMLTRQCAL